MLSVYYNMFVVMFQSEDEAMARALAMSMAGPPSTPKPAQAPSSEE